MKTKIICGRMEFHKTIKHSCGCKETIVTLGYTPNYKEVASKPCPKCFLATIMKG